MSLQLTVTLSHNFTAVLIINSSPLKPMKHDEKTNKMDEAVGADQDSMEVWEMGRWCYRQCQTRQNHQSTD